MTDKHPITPPPELIAKWASNMCGYYEAAQWGADQELEACCEWVESEIGRKEWAAELRTARRSKPPSLKEQALAELNLTTDSDGAELSRTQVELIRRALESFPD